MTSGLVSGWYTGTLVVSAPDRRTHRWPLLVLAPATEEGVQAFMVRALYSNRPVTVESFTLTPSSRP